MSSRFVKILPASFNLLKGAIKDLRGDALMRKHHILFQVVHFHRESGRPQFPFNCLFSRFHSGSQDGTLRLSRSQRRLLCGFILRSNFEPQLINVDPIYAGL